VPSMVPGHAVMSGPARSLTCTLGGMARRPFTR
jgi:hypothetical protein